MDFRELIWVCSNFESELNFKYKSYLIKKAIIFLLLNIFPFVIFLEVTMAILRKKNKKVASIIYANDT